MCIMSTSWKRVLTYTPLSNLHYFREYWVLRLKTDNLLSAEKLTTTSRKSQTDGYISLAQS